MNNIHEWFLSEFSQYGFSLSPNVYDPNNFMPMKFVMVTDGQCGTRKTNIKLTPELANDLHAYGRTYDHHVEALRELVRMELRRQYPEVFKPKDFKPMEKVNKFIFCP